MDPDDLVASNESDLNDTQPGMHVGVLSEGPAGRGERKQANASQAKTI
jgi:hypothetical protein